MWATREREVRLLSSLSRSVSSGVTHGDREPKGEDQQNEVSFRQMEEEEHPTRWAF
jgi:hypothetical protein